MKQGFLITAILASALLLGGCEKAGSPEQAAPAPKNSAAATNEQPLLVQVVGRYNIVRFKGKFYAIPHGVAVNWEKDNVAALPGVLVAGSQESAVALVPKTP